MSPPRKRTVPVPSEAKTRAPRRKNAAQDTVFIEEHAKEFSFTPEGQLVWSGRNEDWGSEYQLPPDSSRCRRLRGIKDGDGQSVLNNMRAPLLARCPKWSMRGAALCLDCASGNEAVKRAVRDRLMGSADALVGVILALAMDDTATHSDRLKAANSALDRAGIRGGVEVGPDVPGWQKLLSSMLEDDSGDADA